MYSLSTSWNASLYISAKAIIDDIKSLGFKNIELSFGLTAAMVAEIIQQVNKNSIKVSSVHNFCPMPQVPGKSTITPDYFSLAALNEEERQIALHYTAKTIETAEKVKAKAVILHTGRVKVKDLTRKLARYCQMNEMGNKPYKKLKSKMLLARAKKSKPYFEKLIISLEQLIPQAKKSGVKLCFENRFYFSEIPDLEEAVQLLKHFSENELYYWHDTGHAQAFENMGLSTHKSYLAYLGARIAGFHLHDIKKCVSDHLAPLKGTFDFTLLKPYIKPEHLKVLEPHQPATAEEIKAGLKYLKTIFGE